MSIEKNIDSKKASTESVRLVASIIKKRAKSGRDADLKPFAPYKRKRGGASKVALESTGEMLDAEEVRLLGDRGTMAGMFDPVQQRKAVIHRLGLGRMSQLRFFSQSDRATQPLSAIRRIFRKELGRATGKV